MCLYTSINIDILFHMKEKCFCKSNDIDLDKSIPFLKAISDENRLKIICLLKTGEKCVCEIVDFLNIAQNLVSHHLKKLRENGLVEKRKNGLKIFYTLNNKNISKHISIINTLILNK